MQDGKRNLFIAKQYVKKLKFNSYGLTAVWDYDDPRHKFMYVDRKGRAVIQGVPISDNWAEEFSDGLVAIVVDEKYGFADRHGSIVITPQYDGAGPFENGHAVVCIGCREACIMPDDPSGSLIEDCEHRTITGGECFTINKAGRVVASVSLNDGNIALSQVIQLVTIVYDNACWSTSNRSEILAARRT